MKKIVRVVCIFIVVMLLAAVLFFGVMWVIEWRPAAVEVLKEREATVNPIVCDTLKIVSWNIGYAGMSEEMDFFQDGGRMVRTTKELTERNLKAIISFLKEHQDADFILLQEVDISSSRSYGQDQFDTILAAFPEFQGWHAVNHNSSFVPVPLSGPIGKIKAGLMTLSRHDPIEVTRVQYPNLKEFPTRIFSLKRAMLSASFQIEGSSQHLYINNTHNSAYSSDEARYAELEFICGYMTDRSHSITVGDWNSIPPGHVVDNDVILSRDYRPTILKRADFPIDWHLLTDSTCRTVRFLDRPYVASLSTTTTIDFAISTPLVEPLKVEVIDLKFKHSDHNPLIFTIVLRK